MWVPIIMRNVARLCLYVWPQYRSVQRLKMKSGNLRIAAFFFFCLGLKDAADNALHWLSCARARRVARLP